MTSHIQPLEVPQVGNHNSFVPRIKKRGFNGDQTAFEQRGQAKKEHNLHDFPSQKKLGQATPSKTFRSNLMRLTSPPSLPRVNSQSDVESYSYITPNIITEKATRKIQEKFQPPKNSILKLHFESNLNRVKNASSRALKSNKSYLISQRHTEAVLEKGDEYQGKKGHVNVESEAIATQRTHSNVSTKLAKDYKQALFSGMVGYRAVNQLADVSSKHIKVNLQTLSSNQIQGIRQKIVHTENHDYHNHPDLERAQASMYRSADGFNREQFQKLSEQIDSNTKMEAKLLKRNEQSELKSVTLADQLSDSKIGGNQTPISPIQSPNQTQDYDQFQKYYRNYEKDHQTRDNSYLESLTNTTMIEMFKKVTDAKLEYLFSEERDETALFATRRGDISLFKKIQTENFSSIQTATFNLFDTIKNGFWMKSVTGEDLHHDKQSIKGDKVQELGKQSMELMIYMLMKKLKSWGGSYDRSLGILVEELKSKAVGPKQEIIEDKFKEFMEEERQAGQLTIKNIAKSAKSIEYFIECINKIVAYLNIVDQFLDEKQLIAESTEYKTAYQNFVASKTLLKVSKFKIYANIQGER